MDSLQIVLSGQGAKCLHRICNQDLQASESLFVSYLADDSQRQTFTANLTPSHSLLPASHVLRLSGFRNAPSGSKKHPVPSTHVRIRKTQSRSKIFLFFIPPKISRFCAGVPRKGRGEEPQAPLYAEAWLCEFLCQICENHFAVLREVLESRAWKSPNRT